MNETSEATDTPREGTDTPRDDEPRRNWDFRAAMNGKDPCIFGVCAGIARLPLWRNLQLGSFEIEAVHIRMIVIILTVIFPAVMLIVYSLVWFFLFREDES